MFILEGNEGFADEVREVERRCVVHCKLLAQVDVFLVQVLDLTWGVACYFFILFLFVLYPFIVLGHHFLTHLIEFLHLSEVEAESNRGDLAPFLYAWIS